LTLFLGQMDDQQDRIGCDYQPVSYAFPVLLSFLPPWKMVLDGNESASCAAQCSSGQARTSALHIGITVMEDADMNQPPAKKPSAPSAQHTKLAEVYGKLDPDLSPELALLALILRCGGGRCRSPILVICGNA
jgi:hypothetical protein